MLATVPAETSSQTGGRTMTIPEDTPTTLTEHEAEQIAAAKATGLTPVVFVHGLWLLASSWDRWADVFREAGYVTLQRAGPTTRRPTTRPRRTPTCSRTRPSARLPTTTRP